MIYYTSDLHFSHNNIIQYCRRPFVDGDEMNSEMIRRWNETVSDDDTIYYLGDFSLGKASEIESLVASLKGHKHLVYGNHDQATLGKHRKAAWESVQSELYIEDDGMVVWLNHYPYGKDIFDKRGLYRPPASRNWDIALNGHCHNEWKINKYNSVNCGGDNWDFYPQTLRQLIEKTEWSGKIKI